MQFFRPPIGPNRSDDYPLPILKFQDNIAYQSEQREYIPLITYQSFLGMHLNRKPDYFIFFNAVTIAKWSWKINCSQ